MSGGAVRAKIFLLFHPKIILSLEIFRLMCKSLTNLLRVLRTPYLWCLQVNQIIIFLSKSRITHVRGCVNDDFVHPHTTWHYYYICAHIFSQKIQSDYFCKLKASLKRDLWRQRTTGCSVWETSIVWKCCKSKFYKLPSTKNAKSIELTSFASPTRFDAKTKVLRAVPGVYRKPRASLPRNNFKLSLL